MTDELKRRIETALVNMNIALKLGKGEIIAIVWGQPHAGVFHENEGVVVRQFQYGMDSRPFHYIVDENRVFFLNNRGKV